MDPEPGMEMHQPGGAGAHAAHQAPAAAAPVKLSSTAVALLYVLGFVAVAVVIIVPSVVLTQSITIVVQSGTTKTEWMNLMATEFNNSNFKYNGKTVYVKIYNVGSPLQENLKPVVWSPSTVDWIAQANADFKVSQGVNVVTNTACPATVQIPVGIVMWKSMAEALGWPKQVSWARIAELAADADGWGKLGKPYGRFHFGHGNPISSTSGRLSVLSMIYAFANHTSQLLTAADMVDPKVISGMKQVEGSVFHYGAGGADLLNRMVNRGKGYLHGVTSYETNVIRWNRDNYPTKMLEPFVLVYPAEGTFWNPNPICIVDKANWTTPEQAGAGQLFVDFVLRKESQEKTLQFGIRPADIKFDLQGKAPFTLENGVNPGINIETIGSLGIPDQAVVDKGLELWLDTKAPATVYLVIDVSGSMTQEKLVAVIKGAVGFVEKLYKNDVVRVFPFSGSFDPNAELKGPGWSENATLATRSATLIDQISNLVAGGGTALYDAINGAYNLIKNRKSVDLSYGSRRNYGLVVMTDGVNTAGAITSHETLLNNLPTGEDPSDAHLFTIGYGADVNKDVLKAIADRTNGLFFAATELNIQRIYEDISTEF